MSILRLTQRIIFSSFILSMSLPVWGQTPTSPCGPDCQQRVETKFEEAKNLDKQGQFDSAAQKYAEVIAEEPLSITSQDAANRAGQCLEKAGRFVEAAAYYETVVSITDARTSETGTKAVWLKRNKRNALFQRAHALEQAGQQDAASQAFQRAIDNTFADLSPATPLADMKQEDAVALQQDAIELGRYLEQHQNPAQATLAYDRAIAIGDARGNTADGENAMTILGAKRDALLKKADNCQRQGCTDDSRQAIQRLRAEFPISLEVLKAGIVEARLDGSETAIAEARVAQELQVQPTLDAAIQAAEPNVYGVDTTHVVVCPPGADGSISVRIKIKAGQLSGNMWNVWVNDAEGRNFGRWYGSGTLARGRIGPGANVTPGAVLRNHWNELQIRILVAPHQSEFLFNGKVIGTLSYQETNAGDAVGKIRLERIGNKEAAGSFVDFDNLQVVPGTLNAQPVFSESFTYSDGAINGQGGWTGQASNEIEISSSVLRLWGGRYEQAMTQLDQVIAQYPETLAATIALEKKARLLTQNKRYQEASQAFSTVLNRLRTESSNSEFFQTTRLRLKRMIADSYADALISGQEVSAANFNSYRAFCSEIVAQDSRPDERAQAHVSIIESFAWERKFTECLAEVDQFLAQYEAKKFPSQTAWVHLYAGIALQELGRIDESFPHLRIVTSGSEEMELAPAGDETALRHARYRIWMGLKNSHASAEDIQKAAEELRTGAPAVITIQP